MSAPAKFFGSNQNKASAVVDVSKRQGALFASTASVRNAYQCSRIQALTAAVVNIESAGPGAILGTITAVNIPAGVEIVGNIQAFTLASGSVIAYA